VNKKTICFHIGTTKTGSTSIQDFLTANRGALQRKGVDVFTERETDPARSMRAGNYLEDRIGPSFAFEGYEQWVPEFIRRITASPAETIILTEELSWFTIVHTKRHPLFYEFVAALQAVADLKLIVYLRRQDTFLMSSYQEMLKNGWLNGKTCRQQMKTRDHRYLEYRERLEGLIPLAGKENIIVRPFEGGQFSGGSLMTDFLHCAGISLTDEFTLLDRKSNVGMSPFLTEIMRCLSFFGYTKIDLAPIVRAKKVQERWLNGQRAHQYLSPRDRRQYMERFAEGNRWIARELLGREDGILFYEPLPEDDGTWRAYRLDPQDVKLFFQDADFLSERIRKKMCRQVVSVCGGRKPLQLRLRDRGKVISRKLLRRTGFRKAAKRIR
jgi:hypothetical protein